MRVRAGARPRAPRRRRVGLENEGDCSDEGGGRGGGGGLDGSPQINRLSDPSESNSYGPGWGPYCSDRDSESECSRESVRLMPSSSLVSSGTVEGVTVGELLLLVALAAAVTGTPCQLSGRGVCCCASYIPTVM